VRFEYQILLTTARAAPIPSCHVALFAYTAAGFFRLCEVPLRASNSLAVPALFVSERLGCYRARRRSRVSRRPCAVLGRSDLVL
jgi:hypothetical protein